MASLPCRLITPRRYCRRMGPDNTGCFWQTREAEQCLQRCEKNWQGWHRSSCQHDRNSCDVFMRLLNWLSTLLGLQGRLQHPKRSLRPYHGQRHYLIRPYWRPQEMARAWMVVTAYKFWKFYPGKVMRESLKIGGCAIDYVCFRRGGIRYEFSSVLGNIRYRSCIQVLRRCSCHSCPGPISNFMHEVGFVHQTTNLSPNRMANWVLASHHSRGGRFHASTARLRTRCFSFIAASSPGSWPRMRTARRSFEFKASIAFVV